MCAPGAAVLRIVNEPLTVPLPEIEHVGAGDVAIISGNGMLVTEHEPASAGLNPLPVIVTLEPAPPELGLRMIEGTRGKVAPGVMIAVATSSEVELVTLIVYVLIEVENQLL